MNWLKRTAVALPLVVLAVAAFGTSSASAATVLCTVNETHCSAAHTEKAGSYVKGIVDSGYEGTKFKIGFFECSHLALGGKTTAESGNPLPMQGESWMTPSACQLNPVIGGTCSEASATQPPARISATSGGNGQIAFGTSGEPMSFTLTCALIGSKNTMTCKWGSSNLAFTYNWYTQMFSTSGKWLTLESKSGGDAAWCGSIGEAQTITATVGNFGGPMYITSN